MFYYEKNMVDINNFNAIPSPGGLSDKPSPLMGEGWVGVTIISFTLP
jgi:hypothetical protein